ncbi:hypothetical protein [Parasitella parasitica]|uniref:RING-type domain-containing protein n=1 Tax=Parasitella parasitica TaxID=35722 RepID=A0A0B7NBY8_9FUNG|nr:hypothetical protein [Parasitella parasitica]
MPDCEHVFDMACIENSLGLEYTCPECQRVYLLPSPYRPTNLSADNSEHQEYVRLRKSVAETNQETNALKVELSKFICEIAICNEVLATANNALEILMLESHDTGSSKPNAPAAHARIKTTEIEANPFKNSTLADFEQIQSQCIIAQRNCNEFLDKKKGNIQETSTKWESSNQNILKKLCSLKTIANTATERLQASQSSTKVLRVDRKNLLLKLNISAQMADNMQRQFELEKATAFELQQKVSCCNKKINELKGLEKRLYMINQQLQTKKRKACRIIARRRYYE